MDEIVKLIEWYKVNGGSQSISAILDCRDKLAVLSFRLAQQASESKNEYNAKYFQRKVNVARSVQRMMSESMAYNKADAKALIENEDYYQKEIQKEAEAYQYDLLLKQVNKVLDAMQQRISYLKGEIEKTQV